jgi:hypothetical protein
MWLIIIQFLFYGSFTPFFLTLESRYIMARRHNQNTGNCHTAPSAVSKYHAARLLIIILMRRPIKICTKHNKKKNLSSQDKRIKSRQSTPLSHEKRVDSNLGPCTARKTLYTRTPCAHELVAHRERGPLIFMCPSTPTSFAHN